MMMNLNPLPAVPTGIQSTAGAVPVKNDKGEYLISFRFSDPCLRFIAVTDHKEVHSSQELEQW